MRMKFVYIMVGLFLIAACSDSDNASFQGPQQATTTSVATVGPITGFGSVMTNGMTFQTGSTVVTVDDEPGILSNLRVGMVVSIRGTVDSESGIARAASITFVDDAEGPISALDMNTHSFIVLGRTVLFDEMTIFENAQFNTLANGNIVQVSGQWRSQERIQATHIERKADAYQAGMKIEVKGQVSNLDPGQQHFTIGTQHCNYAGATLELDGAALANGMYVEVSSNSPMSNGDMVLDRVQLRDRDRDRDKDCVADCDFELDGYVTVFTSTTDFEVDGQPVTTTGSTRYVNGTVDDLALDVRLSVAGTIDTNGVLVADRIVFHMPSIIEIEAGVEAIEASSGTVTTLGIPVLVNEFTLYRDHSVIGTVDFGFDDLAIGDRVEIRAYLDGADVIATRLERDDADDGVTIKAPVEAISQPGLTLLGLAVISDQDTVFQNLAKEVIDADEFFALIVVDDLVRAEGTYDGAQILAEKLFLRVCENNCL